MAGSTAQLSQPAVLRLSLSCDLGEVRLATLVVRQFLAEQGLTHDELMACELALAEACNNAVIYATDAGRRLPIEIETLCDAQRLELRVRDHTAGFDWPANLELPPRQSERGRGLYLIRSLMDRVEYLRGQSHNCLMLQRERRSGPGRMPAGAFPQLADLRRRLAEQEEVIRQMTDELSSCYESLSAIFRYNAELGKSPDLHDFAQRLLDDLRQITQADWFVLRLLAPQASELAVFCATAPFQALPPLPLAARTNGEAASELEAVHQRQDVWFDAQKPLSPDDPLCAGQSGSIGLVHPVYFGDTLFGTLALGKRPGAGLFTASQTNVIHTFADFLAVQIINARLREEQVVSHELEIAHNLQQSLLPKTLPQVRRVTLAGFCQSARQVGGDFYDVLPLGEDRLLLVIADVMGKGIPAAMFAAILRSLVRAAPELGPKPAALLTRANRLLYADLSGVDMFITAQLMFVDPVRRLLVTASAGHCPALLAAPDADQVKPISPEGMPLGILPDAHFAEEPMTFPRKGCVLLYTDGLTEARNPQGELFGQQRLAEWLGRAAAGAPTAQALRAQLVDTLARFGAQESVTDDQTFLILAEASEA
jgi:anti-sigma regulatory factor (Ser/Thr protein kinase)/GAF domain-containing protein